MQTDPGGGDHPGVLLISLRLRPKLADGESFDAGPPQVGAGTLSFLRFPRFLIVVLGLPAVFPTIPAYFRVCVLLAVFLSTETSLYV